MQKRYGPARLFLELAYDEAQGGSKDDPRRSISTLLLNDYALETEDADLLKKYSDYKWQPDRLGTEFLDLAPDLENMGWYCYNAAEDSMKRAATEQDKDARTKTYGQANRQYQRSLRYMRLVYDIREKNLPKLDPALILTRAGYGLVLMKNGIYRDASESMEGSVDSLQKLAGLEKTRREENAQHSVLPQSPNASWLAETIVLPGGADLPTLYMVLAQNYYWAAGESEATCKDAAAKHAKLDACKTAEDQLISAVREEAHAATIWQQLWPEHPLANTTLNRLAEIVSEIGNVYRVENRIDEADGLAAVVKRTQQVASKPGARSLQDYAELLRLTGSAAEASNLLNARSQTVPTH